MKKFYFLSVFFLFTIVYGYSQCTFPAGATQNGATRIFCADTPTPTLSVTGVTGNNFILLNVVQGFTYTFSVGDVFAVNTENLDVFDTANTNIGFATGATGVAITNWVAPFSGEIKIVLSYDACNFSSTAGKTVSLSLVAFGNTQDNQNAMGTDTWVGHVYNWSGVSAPPGGTSPASPQNTMPFNPENYLGYYNIAAENFAEGFGGSYTCFPVLSNDVVRTNVNTQTYAVRYKMRSTRPAGCYIAKFRGDDGIRLYTDGQLVFNAWAEQAPTEYFNVFIYLDGDAELVLDFYENGGQNVVEFSLSPFDTTSNNISLIGSSPVCNNVAPGVIDGSAFIYKGTVINPTIKYQWQVSTNNVTFTDIAGATAEDYSPPATTTAGTKYYRRVVSSAANAASCSFNSNVVAIETLATAASAAPTITAPTNPVCNGFDANWNAVAGATTYLLYVSTNNTFTAIVPGYNGLNVGNVATYTITGLTYNVRYYYRLQAVTSCSSAFSGTANFLYLDNPAQPTMTPISCDSFTINWAAVIRADSYVLDVSTVSNFATRIAGYDGLNVGNVTSYTVSGLPENTPIYFRIRAVSIACGQSGNSASNNNTTTWNGTAWSQSAPSFSRYAIITGLYDMNSQPSFDACSIDVNNGGKLIITAGKYANVENIVRVNGTGVLQVKDDGALVQITDGIGNIGNISAERTTQIRLNDYVYWSSPVLNFPISSISPSTPSGYIFQWNTTVANPNGGQGNWQYPSGNMVLGKGYAVRGPNGFNDSATQAYTATFTGVPNNGIISFPIERGSNTGAGSNGPNGVLRTIYDDNWNLVGNPYPSSIDANTFLTNNTAIDGNIRIWSHTNLPSSAISDPFYNDFVYNYTPNDYIVHNGTATTSGPGTFNGRIASGQAFMVMMNEAASATTGTVAFNNSMRNYSYDNSQFFRNATNNKNRIWLDLISATNGISRTVIGYVNGATNDKDRLYDAVTDYKMNQNFYSILDNNIFSIQGKSLPFLDSDTIPLGFKASQNGSYTIAIGAVDGIFTNKQVIYLEDKQNNIIHNLSENPYIFSTNTGVDNNRFVLRYTNGTLSKLDFANLNSVAIYTNNGKVYIISETKLVSSYEIYDVLGRLLASEKNLSANKIEKDLQIANQALIIKVKLENNQVISKKIIY